MRGIWVAGMLVAVVLAGCAEDAPAEQADVEDGFEEFELGVSDTTGIIRGIVVDGAIVPVADVAVRIVGLDMETTTDEQGRFAFGDVPAGTHFLNITSLLHVPVQQSVTVVAGDAQPALVKVQVQRRFTQDPYLETQQINGYINCGYSAGLSSPCILDYTQLVYPGGAAPFLYGISGDIRRFVIALDDGWQSRINEMAWEPSTGTSESLSMTISFYNRTSSHSYAGASGTSPVRHQMDMDPEREHPDWVGPEGQHDYLVFVNPSTSGSGYPVALVIEQRFELFVNTFYYGMPPEDWSLIAGDGNPF